MLEAVNALANLSVNELQLDKAFARFLRLDVANGDASPDTIRGYRAQVSQWVTWCNQEGIDPGMATTEDVKAYRQYLVTGGYKSASIAHKLVIIRGFYQAAVNAGLRPDNPVAGVKPPRNKRAAEDLRYLTEVELTLLFRTVPKEETVKGLRDIAILGLMGLLGPRTVEFHRASVENLQRRGEHTTLLLKGKGHDRLIYLRPDVTAAIERYLLARDVVFADEQGTPLFTAVSNRARGTRLSRRGIRQVVDSYLDKADLKKAGLSCHGLRHTAATLAYRYSHDLRAVQEMLGHQDPKTTARYARVVDMANTNPALKVPVKLGG